MLHQDPSTPEYKAMVDIQMPTKEQPANCQKEVAVCDSILNGLTYANDSVSGNTNIVICAEPYRTSILLGARQSHL